MSVSKLFTRNIKRVLRLWYAMKLSGIVKLIKNYDCNSENVIVVTSFIKSFFINVFEHDVVLASVMVNMGKTYRFVRVQNANRVQNSFVIYNPHEVFGVGYVNYSQRLTEIVKDLESRNNKVFYSSADIKWWENKDFMHQRFDELNIRTPKTVMLPLQEFNSENSAPMPFPFLVKEEHSCASEGLHKVNSREEFIKVVSSDKFKLRNETIIAQELIDMHKDLRVILVGSEIVLHYWRENPSKEWRPTSTSYGSGVDFVTFPEKWRQYIIDAFLRLNMVTGAFDITWQRDDLTTEPYFLEVSPSYQPNPPFNVAGRSFSYGQWKKRLMLKDSWDSHYIKLIYKIKYKVLEEVLSRR